MTIKQTIKAAIFILLFLFILRSVSYVVRTSGELKERFAGFYAEKQNTLDIILIGSSPVYPCYITPKIWGETGIAAYPLATNNQRPKAIPFLIEEALKTQNPSLIIIEARQFITPERDMTDNMAFTRGVTDNLKYSANRNRAIRALVPEDDEEGRLTYYLDIIKYHTNWRTIIMPDQLKCAFNTWPNAMKGYEINDKTGLTTTLPSRDTITTSAPIPPEQEEYLNEITNTLKKHNQNALFIVTPYALDDAKKKQYNYLEQKLTKEGYQLLDMNDDDTGTGINFATDFYDDGGHTNALGAEKCTTYLQNYLTANYTFEDKRNQETYATWDHAYENWQKKHTEALNRIQENTQTGTHAPPKD